MGAGARHLIWHSGRKSRGCMCTVSRATAMVTTTGSLSLSLPDPPLGCPDATRKSERERASKLRTLLRERGRVEFTPQAGQPNGNKKLRQTALPTPRRPVNIAATTSAGCGDKVVVVVADGAGRLASPRFSQGSQREMLR